MTVRMYSDEQILDVKFRERVISEIANGESQFRKTESLRRQDLYRGNTKQHVMNSLAGEGLKYATVMGILARTPNIRICGKIIDKKARAYNAGVKRESTTPELTASAEELARLLKLDGRMRTSDRFRELHKNALIHVGAQIANGDEDEPVYSLFVRSYAPHQYDVIEDCYDKEKPRCIILSDFIEQRRSPTAATEHDAGLHGSSLSVGVARDFSDGVLADAPSDAGMERKKIYSFWTATLCVKTDDKGVALPGLSPDNYENPIGKLTFLVNAEAQDGEFWAEGGCDVPDSHVIINKQIGDMNYIAYLQGFGQFVVTGHNIKDQLEIGPGSAIMIDYTIDDPKPDVTVVSANPPLDSWMRMIEQHIALLLTTNNLSAGHVAGSLNASNFPSGIALLLEQSESTVGVEDKQAEYACIETEIFQLVADWQNFLIKQGQLDEHFAAVGVLPEDFIVNTRFNAATVTVTEAERLNAWKLRRDLGIAGLLDLIMADNPGMTREDAQKKAEAIRAEQKGTTPTPETEDADGTDLPTEDAPVKADVETDAPALEDSLKTVALNGAQVASMVEVVEKVALGILPRESAVQILVAAFAISDADASKILGNAGKGFKPTTAEVTKL